MAQRQSKKEFSLGQYYSQLQKYESGLGASKTKPLRKDSSSSSFCKEPFKYSNTKPTKQTLLPQRQKITIQDKPQKQVVQRMDRINLDIYKKSIPNDDRKFQNYFAQSLQSSKLSLKKCSGQNNTEQKQNIDFTTKQERAFADHCTSLYGIKNSSTVEEIARQINKRDQVYQLVSNQFPDCRKQDYCSVLEQHFREYELMRKIIQKFKAISNLQTQDLNELYYFLKTDR